jgi:glycosyltransferase involved in cell wall biosynthesis
MVLDEPRQSLKRRAESIAGRDLLCFSHDWTGDPLSKTHLMRLMARDSRVLWVNSIGYRTPSLVSKSDMGRAFRKLAAVPLLVRVAKEFPNASLVMLGRVTMDVSALSSLPNVHILGRRPYAMLPGYAKAFDVALIPFPINEATLNSNPLKAREYLAAGLPVVSTRIPEVQALGGACRIGVDHQSFVDQVRAALQCPGPDLARSESMRGESWAARLREVKHHLMSDA